MKIKIDIKTGVYILNFKNYLDFGDILEFIKYLQNQELEIDDIIKDFQINGDLQLQVRKYIKNWIIQVIRLYKSVGCENLYRVFKKKENLSYLFLRISENDLKNVKKEENHKLEDLIIKIMKEEKRSTSEVLTYLIEEKYYFKKDVSRKIRRIVQQNENYETIGGVIYLKDTK